MNESPQVHELRQLLGDNVLLLPWPRGKKGDKRLWKHLTAEAMNDPAHLRKLAHGNIGVALGVVSGGLCSLDIDSDHEMEEFLRLNAEIANTLRSKGSRGCNLWWRLIGDYPPLTHLTRQLKPWGEWRSTGGQTIIHGQHPDGHDYQIINRVKPIRIEFNRIIWPGGIHPFSRAGAIMSDTERTERTERSERTEANRSGRSFVCPAQRINSVDDAISVALPNASHQNHDRLFKLARAVKALALNAGREIPFAEMRSIFLKWHARAMPFLDPLQSADDYWFEFLESHERASHPLGLDVLAVAWNNSQGNSSPPEAEQFGTPDIKKLVTLCRELQKLSKDQPFFLATRSVQRLFGHKDHIKASRWLNGLCRCGILTIEERGGNDTRRATRFRYLPRLS